ncbi:multiple organellar RNA editing factor 1, mitochondrial [Aristolochia californica]|uniref:multiple organellar RNA editing factor 1, mitochondrial n=1 Tax=Aristolochia californica TaxID=171875 RepID=UPI0035DA4CE5
MAVSTLRLRRLSDSLLKFRPLSTITSLNACASSSVSNASGLRTLQKPLSYSRISLSSFHSSGASFFSSRFNEGDKITEDTILFEGCDYNHWLITIDFPKDPKPTPEQMVETYVQTCAKGLGCSIEEAKQKMYACSTTTYQGFQAVMTEEESEKFRGLPGVVFILPDSYIDPVNKEYGGDKYINGTIIPRPPPVQYRASRPRENRQRYDRQPRDQMPMQQGAPYDRQGPMQGDGRNYAPRQNFGPPSQNFGPPPQNYGPPQQNYGPPPQNYGPPQQNYRPPPQNYGPSGQNDGRGYAPPGGRDYSPGGYQGERRDVTPPNQGAYGQGGQGKFGSQEQKDFRGPESVPVGDYRQGGGPEYGQGFAGPGEGQRSSGNYGQGGGSSYGQGFGGNQWQGQAPGYGQSHGGPIEGQGFKQNAQGNNTQTEQMDHTPGGQTGWNKGSY